MGSGPSSHTRRSLLGGCGVLLGGLLAGCGSLVPGGADDPNAGGTATAVPTPTPVPTPEPTPTRRPPSTGGVWLEVSLEAVDARDVALGVRLDDGWLEPYERTLVDRIVHEDRHTAWFVRDSLAETVYLKHDGLHYGITRSAVERERVRVHRFEIEQVTSCRSASGTPAGADPVSLAALTPSDRRAFLRGNRESFASDANNYCEQANGYAHYPDDALTESILIDPEPTFVRYEGDVYRVRFENDPSWTRTRYRFVADGMGDLATYTATVVPRVVWDLDEVTLSERERSYVETLRQVDTYERSGSVPDVAREFHERVVDNAYQPPGDSPYLSWGDQYFRYEYSLAVA